MSVRVQERDFDIGAEVAALTAANTDIGAVASFIGKVRGTAKGKTLQTMSLEHYEGMTERELEAIEADPAGTPDGLYRGSLESGARIALAALPGQALTLA